MLASLHLKLLTFSHACHINFLMVDPPLHHVEAPQKSHIVFFFSKLQLQ
ncbi:unnamed protein product [Musa acuminata subsp. burmannicoides]